jgi:hypothetical protein
MEVFHRKEMNSKQSIYIRNQEWQQHESSSDNRKNHFLEEFSESKTDDLVKTNP